MSKSMPLTIVLVLLAISSALAAEGPATTAEAQAREFVSLLAQQEYSQAVARFDATMTKALSAERLQTIWKARLQALGAFQKIVATRSETVQQYRVVFVTCQYEQGPMDVKVVFGPAGKVAGLFFVPTVGPSPTPPYAQPARYREREVVVGSDPWSLPGTLTMPVGPGPFPALVLVHGSGPNDRDERVGPNKPFRDLAWGLASRGIAVLRYEKRTRQHAAKVAALPSFTVRDETIDDAVAAVALLRKTEGIDAQRVFVLGHSLGGSLVPRIAAADPQIAGWVVLAGSARPIEDLVLEQTEYQLSLKDSPSAEDQAALETLRQQVAQVKQLTAQSPPGLYLGAPPSYWLDLRGYEPAKAAKQVTRPLLILQGEADCQVSFERDFRLWRQALSDRQDVTFKSYPNLNHLFFAVPGKSTGREYQQPGNVAEAVINDLGAWITHLGR